MATILILIVCPLIGWFLGLWFVKRQERRQFKAIMAGQTSEARAKREGLYRQAWTKHFASKDNAAVKAAPGLRIVDNDAP